MIAHAVGCGTGIGRALRRMDILRLSAEQFTDPLIDANRNRIAGFPRGYHGCPEKAPPGSRSTSASYRPPR